MSKLQEVVLNSDQHFRDSLTLRVYCQPTASRHYFHTAGTIFQINAGAQLLSLWLFSNNQKSLLLPFSVEKRLLIIGK